LPQENQVAEGIPPATPLLSVVYSPIDFIWVCCISRGQAVIFVTETMKA
jgi:hypothetical protein